MERLAPTLPSAGVNPAGWFLAGDCGADPRRARAADLVGSTRWRAARRRPQARPGRRGLRTSPSRSTSAWWTRTRRARSWPTSIVRRRRRRPRRSRRRSSRSAPTGRWSTFRRRARKSAPTRREVRLRARHDVPRRRPRSTADSTRRRARATQRPTEESTPRRRPAGRRPPPGDARPQLAVSARCVASPRRRRPRAAAGVRAAATARPTPGPPSPNGACSPSWANGTAAGRRRARGRRRPPLMPSEQQMARAIGSGTQDALKDIDDGEETALNSKRWKFASFFNRVKKQVADHWHPEEAYRPAIPPDRSTVEEPPTPCCASSSSPTDAGQRRARAAIGRRVPRRRGDRGLQAGPAVSQPAAATGRITGTINFRFGFLFELSGAPRMRCSATTTSSSRAKVRRAAISKMSSPSARRGLGRGADLDEPLRMRVARRNAA